MIQTEVIAEFGTPVRLVQYDSVREAIEAASLVRNEWTLRQGYDYGTGRSIPELLDIVRGKVTETATIDRARALEHQVNIARETAGPAWLPDFAGAYPIVGDYLAGMPDHMRRLRNTTSERAPIRIFAGCDVGGCVMEDETITRGCAILALAMRTAETRPCELYVFSDSATRYSSDQSNPYGNIIITTRLHSPFDLSQAAIAMAEPGFSRRAMFGLQCANTNGNAIMWLHCNRPTTAPLADYAVGTDNYNRVLRTAMGAEPNDLLLPGTGNEYIKQLLADPVAWIQEQINQMGEPQD